MLKINHLFLILAASLFAISGMISAHAADESQKQTINQECFKIHKDINSAAYKDCVKAKDDAAKEQPEANDSTPE